MFISLISSSSVGRGASPSHEEIDANEFSTGKVSSTSLRYSASSLGVSNLLGYITKRSEVEMVDNNLYASELAKVSGDTGKPFRIPSVNAAAVSSSLAVN